MGNINVHNALESVEMTYSDLTEIANEMVSDFFEPANRIINELKDINSLTNDEIRNYMIRLSLAAYSLGEIKEKSALKAEIAQALRKESIARNYAESEGTASNKENTAILRSNQQIVAEALYNLIANLFRTKMDSCHRTVDVLKSVLMSRNMEAKLTTSVVD